MLWKPNPRLLLSHAHQLLSSLRLPSLPLAHPTAPRPNPSFAGLGSQKSYSAYARYAYDPPSAPEFDKRLVLHRLDRALEDKDIEEAWRALQSLRKNGELPDRFLLNRALSLLAYGGDAVSLNRAQRVLSCVKKEDKAELLDGDSLSLVAVAYARADLFHFAANAVRFLVNKNYFPSSSVWTTVLEHLANNLGGAALSAKVFLEICMYLRHMAANKRKFAEAKDQLLSMKPDTKAFNVVLKACVIAGDSLKADEIVEQMPVFEVTPDNDSFISLIKVYEKERRIKQLQSILSRLKQAQVVPDYATLNALVSAYVSLGEVDAAAEVVYIWRQVGQRATESREEILNGGMMVSKGDSTELSVGAGGAAEVFEVSTLIAEWGGALEHPNGDTYAILLKGFLGKGGVKDAAKFLIRLHRNDRSEYVACASAVDGLLSMGLRNDANAILREMAVRKAPAEAAAYATLVRAYCKIPQPAKAERVLKDSRIVGHDLDVTCYDSVIEAYNLIQDYEEAFLVYRDMKKHRIAPLEPSFTRLLEVFEKKRQPFLMCKMIDVACREPPLKVELRHWNAITRTFCKGKMMHEAKQMMKRMMESDIQPDAITYYFLLNGYLVHGGNSEEILRLWPEVMEKAAKKADDSLKLNKELLEAFLAAFVRYGYFNRALEVIGQMEDLKILVDRIKYRNLYLEFHKDLFTSKHPSTKGVDKSQERRKQVEAFKSWVGLKHVH